MSERAPDQKINFTLSNSAEAYLRKSLPGWVEIVLKRGSVPILTHTGGGRAEKDGKIIWQYKGPAFVIAGQKTGSLSGGKYHDLVGCSIWIEELECIMLKGRTLTMKKE